MPRLPSLPPSVAWPYALAALTNAQRLHAAATILYEAEQWGPCRSLAISAREELGKFFRATFIALELTSSGAAIGALRSHEKKQATGAVLAAMPKIASLDGIHLDLSSLEATSGRDFLAAVNNEMLSKVDSIEVDQAAFGPLESVAEEAESGGDESRRQRGLYVDLDFIDEQWVLHSPSDVTELEAKADLDQLDGALRLFAGGSMRVSLNPDLEALSMPDLETMRQMLSKFVGDLWKR